MKFAKYLNVGGYLSTEVVFRCFLVDVRILTGFHWKFADLIKNLGFSLKQRCFPLGSSLRSGNFVRIFSEFMPESTGNLHISLKSIDSGGFHRNVRISSKRGYMRFIGP